MADRTLHLLPESELEAALRGLTPAIDWPSAGRTGEPDLATAVRVRIESMPIPAEDRMPWRRPAWLAGMTRGPVRRALVLALVALLAVAAVAGAVGLGLPGLRLILGEPPPTVAPSTAPTGAPPGSPTPTVLGGSLRLGEALDAADPAALDERAGFHVRLPTDPGIGTPAAAWIDEREGGQVTLLWPPNDRLPATTEADVGLLISQFRGTLDDGFFAKSIDSGTIVAPVEVGGDRGYWLSGEQHLFFWEGPDGFVDDARRWVGDVLVWSDGPITYRLETSLGRAEAIRIAESMD
jgi:hypothetical protein